MLSRVQTHARGGPAGIGAGASSGKGSQGRKGKPEGSSNKPTRPHSGGSHPQQSPMSPQQQNYQNLFVAKVPDHIRQEDIMGVFVEGLRRVNSFRVSVEDKTGAGPQTGDDDKEEKGQSESASAPCGKLVPPPFDIPNPISAMVSLDPATGVSKGFGFALFPDNETGAAAHKAMNNAVVMYNHVTKRVLNIWFPGEEAERKFKEREKQLKKSAKAASGARKGGGGGRGSGGAAKNGTAVVADGSSLSAAVDDNLSSGNTPLFDVVDEGVSITPWRLVLTGSRFDGTTAAAASPCLYVRNIPLSMSQTEVGDLLGRFGNVVFCAVRHDHSQRPIWVVFVEYDSIDSATKALDELHGNHRLFPEASAPILAKYADTQEQREQRKLMRGGYGGVVGNGVGGVDILGDSAHKSSLSCEPQHGSFGGGANNFVGSGSNPQLSPQHDGGLTTLHVREEVTQPPLQQQYTYTTTDLSARPPHAAFYQPNNNNNINMNTNNSSSFNSHSYSNCQHHYQAKHHSHESNAMLFSPTTPFNQQHNFQHRSRTHHQHHQPNHVAPEGQEEKEEAAAAAHLYSSTSRNGASTAPYSHHYRHHDHYQHQQQQQQRNMDGSYLNNYNTFATTDHRHPSATAASSTSVSTPFTPASYHHHHHHEGSAYPTNHDDTENGVGANDRGHNHDGEHPPTGGASLAHHFSSSLSSPPPPPPPHSHAAFLPAGGSTSSPPTALFDHHPKVPQTQTQPQQSFLPPSSSHSYNNNNNNINDHQYQYQPQQQQHVKVASTHHTNRGYPPFSSPPPAAYYSSLHTPTEKSNNSVNVHASHNNNNNVSGPRHYHQLENQQHVYQQHQQYNNINNNDVNKQTTQASLPRPVSGSGAGAFALASGGNNNNNNNSNANLFSVPAVSTAPTTTTSSASNNSVLPIEINIYAPRESGHSSRSTHNGTSALTAAHNNSNKSALTNTAGVTHYNNNNLALFMSTSSDSVVLGRAAPTATATAALLGNDTGKKNNNDNSGGVSTCTATTHVDDETAEEVTGSTSKPGAVGITQPCKSASENGNVSSTKNDSGPASTNGGEESCTTADKRGGEDTKKKEEAAMSQQHQRVARRGPSITIPLENTNIPRGEAGGVPQCLLVHLPNPSLHDVHNTNNNKSTNELSLGESEMMMLTGGGAAPTSRPPTRPGSGVGATGSRPQAPMRGEGPNNAAVGGQRLGFRNPYSAAATPKNSAGNSATSFALNNNNNTYINNNGGERMGTPTPSSPLQHASPSHYRFNPYDRASPLVATTREMEGSTTGGGAFGGGNSYSNEGSLAATPTAAASLAALANVQGGSSNRMRGPLNSGGGIRPPQDRPSAATAVTGEMGSLTMCGSTFAMDTAISHYSVKNPTGARGDINSGSNNNNNSNNFYSPQQLLPSHHSLPATPFSGPLHAHSPHTAVGTPSAIYQHQQQHQQQQGGGSNTSLSPTPTAGSATGLGGMKGRMPSGRGGGRGVAYNNNSNFSPNSNQQYHNFNNNADRSPSTAASHSHSNSAATPHGPAVNITIPSNWDTFAATTPMGGAGFGTAPPTFAADDSQLPSHRSAYPNSNNNNYYAEEQGPSYARREQFSSTPLQHHQHDLLHANARSDVGGALRAMSGGSVYSNPTANATTAGADDNTVTNNRNMQMLFNNNAAPNNNTLISQYMQQGNIRPNSGAHQGGGKPRGGAQQQQQQQHAPLSSSSSRPVSGSQPQQQAFSTTIPATHGGVLRPMWAKGIEWEAVKK